MGVASEVLSIPSSLLIRTSFLPVPLVVGQRNSRLETTRDGYLASKQANRLTRACVPNTGVVGGEGVR